MGSISRAEMAAAQVIVSVLWAATLATCAPQGGLLSVLQATPSLNQNQEVVSQVVGALQPSIARAVAEALAGLNSRSVSTSSRGSISTGSRGSLSSSSSSSRSRSRTAEAAERAAFEAELAGANIEGPTARPVYNFQYKVADDGEQTYISKEEARDGDDVSGSYSYVDADGALVTVNYKAGAMGYSETRDKQEGFVQMRAKPIRTGALAVDNSAAVTAARAQAAQAAQAAAAARRAESARLAAARQEATRLEAARQESARLEASRLTASRQSSSINQNAIISQVISSLQPLITRAVEGAITSSSSGSSANSASSSSSGSSIGSVSRTVSSGDIASTFGDGGLTVSVETPDFQFAF